MMLFSTLSLSKENCLATSTLFKSKDFDFRAYNVLPATPEELGYIQENHEEIPMQHAVDIYRVQETEYGKRWLLNNLDKLRTTDLRLDLMKPHLFTIEQQRTILNFALKHQRSFMWRADFCTIFPDLNVFDHGWLWLYLDPYCFSHLSYDHQAQLVGILQKNLSKGMASLAIIPFLILMEAPINWKDAATEKNSNLMGLFKNYEKAYKSGNGDQLWVTYELLVPHFKRFPLGKKLATFLHLSILMASYYRDGDPKHFSLVTEFISAHEPSDLSCRLAMLFFDFLSTFNEQWHSKFKLSRYWSTELLNNYIDYTAYKFLPRRLQLERWRIVAMEVTLNTPLEFGNDPGIIYSNAIEDGELLVDYYAKEINKLGDEGYFELSPKLKFDCEKLQSDWAIVSDFWTAKIYQMAINKVELPKLEKEFENIIVMSDAELEVYFLSDFKALRAAVCLNSTEISPETVKAAIISTRKTLNDFGISIYYDNRDDATIFSE